MVARSYDEGGRMAGFIEFVDLAATLASDLGSRTPLLATARAAHQVAIKGGYGDYDQAVLLDWLLGTRP
jgi:3-hydroxyisobutyrate dehydrogenase-like beta-hydroxyacid dehydrogenase